MVPANGGRRGTGYFRLKGNSFSFQGNGVLRTLFNDWFTAWGGGDGEIVRKECEYKAVEIDYEEERRVRGEWWNRERGSKRKGGGIYGVIERE